ncbi:MAG TPA: universal stress protein [Candidatus Acidoferrum sp.]|nr:universal stress protein [Candidatus Acidoferrum sp.]
MSTGRVTASDDLASSVVQLQRILVATDFSGGARAALDCALGIAKRFQSKVYLVHVIPAGVLHYVSPERAEEVVRQAKSYATDEMQRLVKETGCEGLIEADILSGSGVWPLLREFVKAHAIDLLVVGTQGRTAAQKQLLGPVAEEIFRLADCPILTVGSDADNLALARSNFQRILYATNFKPYSERAAPFAHSLEREHGAKLTVLHVVEEPQVSATNGSGIVSEFMIKRMRKGVPAECVGKCDPEFQVRFGDAGEQILQAARELQSDLIILGLRAGNYDAGDLPSAVAYKLVCQSPCPVLTTRQ